MGNTMLPTFLNQMTASDVIESSRQLVSELTGSDTRAMSHRELLETLETRLTQARTFEDASEAAACEVAFIVPLVDELRQRLTLH
jgi:hypothetical protein